MLRLQPAYSVPARKPALHLHLNPMHHWCLNYLSSPSSTLYRLSVTHLFSLFLPVTLLIITLLPILLMSSSLWVWRDFDSPATKQSRELEDKKEEQEDWVRHWKNMLQGHEKREGERQRQSGRDSWDGPTGLWREELNFPTPSVTSPWVESSTYVKPPTTTHQ